MIVTFRTDQKEAYVGLYELKTKKAEKIWEAHRELSNTLLKTVEDLLRLENADWDMLSGIVIFKGPGSFTGLRIGATVANTLAESLTIPIVGVQGDSWETLGIERLERNENDRVVLPEYGGEANITKPRK